jgi:hypothetical protein
MAKQVDASAIGRTISKRLDKKTWGKRESGIGEWALAEGSRLTPQSLDLASPLEILEVKSE